MDAYILELLELSADRCAELAKEYRSSKDEVKIAISNIADHYFKAFKMLSYIQNKKIEKESIEKTQKKFDELYANILPDNYATAYENPAFAVKKLGSRAGKLFSVLAADSYEAILALFAGDLEMFTNNMALFIQIACVYLDSIDTNNDRKTALEYAFKEGKSCYKSYKMDRVSTVVEKAFKRNYDPQCYPFIRDIIMKSDLSDLRYLYKYGEYITENEIKIAEYLNSMPESQVKAMADTLVDGYVRGFDVMSAKFKPNGVVRLAYPIGFERMLYFVVKRFEEIGIIISANTTSVRTRCGRNRGVSGCFINKQFSYDHRNDSAFYYDKLYAGKQFEEEKRMAEELKDQLALFDGPALIETFGEENFTPVNKKECIKKTIKQNSIENEYRMKFGIFIDKYIPGDATSFAIIAYPIPSIGEHFEEIFRDTVKINTLDNDKWTKIQQSIIDELDQGYACRVTGRNGNETDITVSLRVPEDPEKETGFENCTADVNIPVGEVFTSPVLKGTNGLLHVSRIFLNGLEYKNLKVWFKDGKTEKLSCDNFPTEKENQDFLSETLLHHHDFLPLGEFAIGTNTEAFVMAEKYDIQAIMPILIAEKTGPHFAIGDTCYSHSEDIITFNPDGKKMIAKENECSALRKTEPQKAYFNCHTDITIPYSELGDIVSVRKNGNNVTIIKNGRFVVKGTEELNIVLDK